MSAEYSVEKIRDYANAYRGVSLVTFDMLTAYANRIEADESAVPVGHFCEMSSGQWEQTRHEFAGLLGVTPLFTHPPAQAAQVDASDAELMAEWFKADGSVHGPNVETVTMPQAKYLAFRRSITHPHSPDAADSGRVTEAMVSRAFTAWNESSFTGGAGLRARWRESIEAALAAQGQGESECCMHGCHCGCCRACKNGSCEPVKYAACDCITSTPPASPAGVPDAKAMAYRFMGWRLPDDFRPDCGISFDPESLKSWPGMWPTGTNLFHVGQAEQMFRYVLAAAPSATPEGGEVGL